MKKELELSEKIERRLEMIYAHTKLGKTIQEVIKEFGVCLDTYVIVQYLAGRKS